MLSKTRRGIVAFIDFFHKPVAKYIPTQTFRYIACGGTNTVSGILLFSFVFNYIFKGHNTVLFGSFPITDRVASLFTTFCFNVPFGFMLSSYVVFPESQIDTKVQFVRYAGSAVAFLGLQYVLTKSFAWALPGVRGDVANVFVTMITAVVSYLTQKFYTFKIDKAALAEARQEHLAAVMEEEK